MKLTCGMANMLWILLGIPLLALSVVTALTVVFSILGIVALIFCLAVPFGFAPPVLQVLFKPGK